MQRMQKLLTVKDVMQRIPLGKTKCTEIVNALPHIKAGKRLLITEQTIEDWLRANTHDPTAKKKRPAPVAQPQDGDCMLTDDGRVPTRKQLRELEERAKKKARVARC